MWPSHVINLAENTARLAAAGSILGAQGIDFGRVGGVNGWALTVDEIATFSMPSRTRVMVATRWFRLKSNAVPLLLQNPKFLVGHDTEVV
jgi:GR25 family glycosyltransferase involved in LPS biosynthesis